jgi:hypothetical protein
MEALGFHYWREPRHGVGPRAREDVAGGGSTVRMHRVVVGSYVGSSAFMHTELERNR